jgi:excisionase family DNA binding protein
MTKYITTQMAAKILGLTPDYIRKLCCKGKIKATKHGPDWILQEKDLHKVIRQRKAKEVSHGIDERSLEVDSTSNR